MPVSVAALKELGLIALFAPQQIAIIPHLPLPLKLSA
jgi:hypothetical protein